MTETWTEPAPGDPDGPWQWRSTQLAKGCAREDLDGWDFTTTWAFVGEPFDPDVPPDGGGWEKNTHKAGGFEVRATSSGRNQQIAYWRRKRIQL